MKAQAKALKLRRDEIVAEHKQLSDERLRILSVIKEVDTFRRYKALQKEQIQRRSELAFLEDQLSRVDAVAAIDRSLRELRSQKDAATTAIERSLAAGGETMTAVTRYFNRFVKQVLMINGEFIVSQNTNGNIDFEIRTKDVAGSETSQDRGHSYHRLLCALFDLAVLRALEDKAFYHFVYHDGIFEGLHNNVKIRLFDQGDDIRWQDPIHVVDNRYGLAS